METTISDAYSRALLLRNNLKINKDILVADFSGTLEGKDTSKVIDLMPNIYSGEYVFRTKFNIKELDPIASKEYNASFFDVSKKSDEEIENFTKRQVFDFPIWYKHSDGFSMKKIMDYNFPFILQVAGCNFHNGSSFGGCWYCFVDDSSNDGKISAGKAFLSVNETIDSMISARNNLSKVYEKHGVNLNIKQLRVSGGEPTIVLDWILGLWREVEKRGLDFVGQFDTNLSTGSVIDSFEKSGVFEKNILEKLASYPIKVLAAIKGVDLLNLEGNVQAKTTLDEQLYSLSKYINAGFDVYPQMYNPNPESLENYLACMDKKIDGFSLKVHIGPLKIYSPTRKRLEFKANSLGINPDSYLSQKEAEWNSNYKGSCEIIDRYLQKSYGVGYKDIARPDITLKVK